LNTINQTSNNCLNGIAGYTDNTHISTDLMAGGTYALTVGTSSTYEQGFGIWIDYNQDGDFEDTDEFVYASPSFSTSVFNGSVTIPADATTGTTRLRVRGIYSDVVTATDICTFQEYGEVEDYSVNIYDCSLLSASAVVTDAKCKGSVDGAIDLTVSGANNPYSIIWSNASEDEDISMLEAGDYLYTITDVYGCAINATVAVGEPTELVASISGDNVLCNGGTTTVTVSAIGGTAAYTNTGDYTVSAGTHEYTITDANGCTDVVSISISEPTELVASISGDNVLCNGGTTTVTVSATGGTAAYTNTGDYTVSAGTHEYTVTDANGCTDVVSISISEPTELVASASGSDVLCFGGTTVVTVSATGGTAAYTNTGDYTVSAGTHEYTVSDANGCTDVVSISISEPTELVASISGDNVLCNGGTTTVTVSAAGGTAAYTNTGDYTVLAGTHEYTVTDANGCTDVVSISISEPTELVASISGDNVLCNGGTTTVTVSATGGTAAYTNTGDYTVSAGTHEYTVTDANGCTDVVSISISEPTELVASISGDNVLCNGGTTTVTVSAAGGTAAYTNTGDYTVLAGTHEYTVTDANGCTDVVSISISEPTELVASISGDNVLCNGGTTTVTVSATGGTAAYTNTGDYTVSAGTHEYTVTDANGCTDVVSISISEPTELVASASGSDVLCFGGTTVVTVSAIGGTAAYTNTGDYTVSAGTHEYTVTDANGCTDVVSISISEPTELVASASDSDVLCFGGTTTVTVSATGGTAAYTNTGDYTVSAGTHEYTVTDANGCTDVVSISISEPTELVASASGSDVLCFGGTTTVTVSAIGGTAAYTNTGDYTVSAGTHEYTVTDANGCTDVVSISISEPTELVASISGDNVLCNGGTTTVTVSATGGTVAYTNTGDYTVSAGTHEYTVTDVNGCSDIVSISISEPTQLQASINTSDASCGNTDGSAEAFVTGGTGVYSYLWTNGSTLSTSENLGAGVQFVTITDGNLCSVIESASINNIGGPEITNITIGNATCFALNNGSINYDVTGGVEPYDFAWSNSATTQNISNLNAGIYFVTVSDDNSCFTIESFEVNQPDELTIQFNAEAIHCNGGTTILTVSANGGIEPYSNIGEYTVFAGSHEYTVIDANGCDATSSIDISQPEAIVATATSGTVLCKGGTTTIAVSAEGGSAPYTNTGDYSVNAGYHEYTIYDVNGCSAITSVIVNEPSELNAFANGSDILCFGGTTNITVSAMGGTEPYQNAGIFTVSAGYHEFIVLDANGCSATTNVTIFEPQQLMAYTNGSDILCNGGTTDIYVGAWGGTFPYTGEGYNTVTAGTYNYTITDANGCNAETSFTVSEPSALTADVTAGTILCNGGTAEVTVTANGGVTPYMTGVGTQNLTAGYHEIYVTDANGCTVMTSVTLTEPDAIVLSATITNVSALGNDGAIDLTVNGGVTPYNFAWSNLETTEDLSAIAAGIYSVEVTDANGCIESETFVVNSVDCTVEALATGTDLLCNNDNSGTAMVAITGATEPVTIIWSTGATTEEITGLAAGTYSVTVVDADFCSDIAEVLISEPAQLGADGDFNEVSCYGANDGSFVIYPFGGTAPYSVIWTNGSTEFSLANLAPGYYAGTLTDANGCSISGGFDIYEPELLEASATITYTSCDGTTEVYVDAQGGTFPYNNTGYYNLTAGTHEFTVTDANGCEAITSITINEYTPLSINVTATDILCFGQTSEVNVTANGGTAPYTGEGVYNVNAGTYTYSVYDANWCYAENTITISEPQQLMAYTNGSDILCNGGTTDIYVGAWGGTFPYTGEGYNTVTAGTYNYTITDANGCNAETTITVSEPSALTADVTAGTILCNGGTAEVTVTANGGVTPYMTGVGTQNLTAGYHEIYVTDANGCTVMTSVTLTEPDVLALSADITMVSALGNDGAIDLTVNGGVTPYNFAWSNLETTEDLSAIAAGIYSVEVTDANGCIESETFVVNSVDCTIEALATGTDLLCNNDNSGTAMVTITGATEPVVITWSTGAITEGITGLAAGTYTVTVVDADFCSDIAEVVISEPASLDADGESNDITCFGANDGSFELYEITGGTSPYSILWSNGSTEFNLSNLEAGEYFVTLSDANGCSISGGFEITEPELLEASATITYTSCDGTTEVYVDAQGGTFPYNNTGYYNLTAGTHEFTVTDANGCEAITSITINEYTPLSINVTATDILCFGQTSEVNVTANGGTAPYTGEGVYNVNAGTYTYSVYDANWCYAETTITISEPQQLMAYANGSDILCNGGTTDIYVGAWGGTFPYTGEGYNTVTAGTYNYTITDANGCNAETSITVSEPNALTADVTAGTILCNGGTAEVTVTANGGVTPYMTGVGTQNLTAGYHEIYVTDANGCTVMTSVTLTEPDVLALSADITMVSALGNDGAIDLTVNGGVTPYNFAWSNLETTEDLSAIAAGIYSVEVTDANGCIESETFVVNSVDCTVEALATGTDLLCNNDNSGTAMVSITGATEPVVITWSTGATTEEIIDLAAGTYSVTVVDADFCVDIAEVVITEPTSLDAEGEPTNITCFGANDGSFTLSPIGGTAPYSVIWSNGSTEFSLTNLAPGYYAGTLTDANGCSISGGFDITEPELLAVELVATDITCFGYANGLIDATVTGGTLPYSIEWSNNEIAEDLFGLEAGMYHITVMDANGCMAHTMVEITEPATIAEFVSAEICEGDSYELADGTFATETGVYEVVLVAANGCDSTITTDLLVNPTYYLVEDVQICTGTDYVLADGTTADVTGIYTVELMTATGCDSTIVTNLTVTSEIITDVIVSICEGDSYFAEGDFQTISGTYYDTLTAVNGGCDSLIVTSLTVNPTYAATEDVIICEGNSYVLADGTEVSTTDTYVVTLPTMNGCDSTITTNLIVLPASYVFETAEICEGDSYELADGTFATETGVYEVLLVAANGCDSTITTDLLVHPTYYLVEDVQICTGTEYVLADGTTADVTGTYTVELMTATGCDSTIVTNLTVTSEIITDVIVSICEGDSYFAEGDFQTISGTYYDTLTAVNGGCDSLIVTSLTVNPTYAATEDVIICEGNSYVLADGTEVSTTDTYVVTLPTMNGCDSTITTNLIVLPASYVFETADICEGDSYELADGTFATETGVYEVVLIAANGCDSIIYTDLLVNPSYYLVEDVQICNGTTYMLADGTIADADGTYTISMMTTSGCDSTIVTNLTLTDEIITDVFVAICEGDSYFAEGEWQTETGFYYDTLIAVNGGCDSIVVTQLNVNPALIVDLGADDTLCYDYSEVMILDAGLSGMTYLWSDGSTAQTLLVDAAELGLGTYTYMVTVSDGICTTTDTIVILVDICNQISVVEEPMLVSVYPNPSTGGMVNVVISNKKTDEIQLNLYDAAGRMLMNEKLLSSETVLDMSRFATGVYTLTIRTQSEIINHRLIITGSR
jgi:hypothetical protein